MPFLKTVRSSENFHIVLWLLKDLCWVLDLHTAGVVMIAPTVGMAVWIAWRCRAEIGELLHGLAVVCWILANSVWMIGEFFFEDHSRRIAALFFFAGLACVAWYYLVVLPRDRRAAAVDAGTAAPTREAR